MEAFFTKIHPESATFPFFSVYHIVPLVLTALIIYVMILNREKIKNNQVVNKIRLTIGLIMLTQQVLLYTWYMVSDLNLLQEALPLYLSRVITIITVVCLLFGLKSYNYLVFHIGMLSGAMALLLPDTSGYVFPHVMYTQFFITHAGLLITACFVYFVEDYKPNREDLIKLMNFIILYAVSVSIINYFISANYGYMECPPKSANFFKVLPKGLVYKTGITLIMYAIIWLINVLFRPGQFIKPRLKEGLQKR